MGVLEDLLEHMERESVGGEFREVLAMREVLGAIEEWREARRAILAYPMKKEPDAEQLALWARLGEAEDRLMRL